MVEWSKAQHWKCCVRATVPWVRIPPLPPFLLFLSLILSFFCELSTQKGHKTMIKFSNKPVDKYLFISNDEIFLRFRLPNHLGGGEIKKSLKTSDIFFARKIRDQYINTILTNDSIINILEFIQENIKNLNQDIHDFILYGRNNKEIFLQDAINIYLDHLVNVKKNKAGGIKSYNNYLRVILKLWGNIQLTDINTTLAKKLREFLLNKNLSSNTISHYFRSLRSFLLYLYKDKIFDTRMILEKIQIELPNVKVENTAMIEPHLADACMNCVSDWTIIPKIARYTGMRSGEIFACCSKYQGCKIVSYNKTKCFFISKEFCKTSEDRYVPIIDKLEDCITADKLRLIKTSARFDGTEPPTQKKYNKVVKKIIGCQKVSFHSWRVYANTMMMEAGIDELLCCRILGHKMKNSVHYGYTAGRLEAMKKALELIP